MEILKVDEIFVGNWYLADGLDPKQITFEDISKLSRDPDCGYYQPLPLNEDILPEFGFQKNEEHWFIELDWFVLKLDRDDLSISLWNKRRDEWICIDNDRMDDVHQLQNLYFILSGKKLEFNKRNGSKINVDIF